jgi:phage gpG-like protein
MEMTINVNGDERMLSVMNDIEELMENPKKSLEESGELVLSEVQKQFDQEGERLGSKWQALSRATLIAKARAGYGSKGILERTGKLKGGFESELKKYQVRIHNPVTYYEYHQVGTNKLPQRVMLATPETLKQKIVAIFIKNIKAAIS